MTSVYPFKGVVLMVKTYTGINIQWPISRLILSGQKTVETRTYPIPAKFLNKEMILIETPGKLGRFKSRMCAIIKFTDCFEYDSRESFYEDSSRHRVDPNSPWAYDEAKGKWGWEVEVCRLISPHGAINKRIGIKYTTNLIL